MALVVAKLGKQEGSLEGALEFTLLQAFDGSALVEARFVAPSMMEAIPLGTYRMQMGGCIRIGGVRLQVEVSAELPLSSIPGFELSEKVAGGHQEGSV